MSDVMSPKPARRTNAEYQAELARLLAEIGRTFEGMDQKREEIRRLREETREVAARTSRRMDDIQGVLDGLKRRAPGPC